MERENAIKSVDNSVDRKGFREKNESQRRK